MAQLNSLFGPRLISAFGSGSAWDSGISSMGSAQLVVGLGSAWGSAQGSPGDWLGTRDSTWLVSWPISRHLARLGAWDRAGTRARFGLEARPGSRLRARLRTRRSTWIGVWLGSSRFNETKHEQTCARQKRPAEKERRRKNRARKNVTKKYHDPPPPQRNSASTRFLQIRLGSESCDQISASPNGPKTG